MKYPFYLSTKEGIYLSAIALLPPIFSVWAIAQAMAKEKIGAVTENIISSSPRQGENPRMIIID